MHTALRSIPLFVVALALTACGKPPAPAAPPPAEVGVVEVNPESVAVVRDLVGRLSPVRSADVRARVSGVVLKRVYAEGSDVKEGDVMFEIDPAPLKASLASAQASLAQARAAATNAKNSANRARELIAKNYVSRSDFDNAEANERTTAALVQGAQAAVQSAQINLGYATVRAPISGRAGQQQVTEGALVGEGAATLLTTIDQIDALYANFTLGVNDLNQLRKAAADGSIVLLDSNKVEVQLTGSDGAALGAKATLDFSDVAVDPATSSVALRAKIENTDLTLLPGMYVTGQLNLGQLNNAYRIGQSIVQRDTRGAFVLAIGAENKVERRDIVAERIEGKFWIVSSGIQPGDRLIASGTQKAKVGDVVNPTPWQPTGDKPSTTAPAKP